MSQAQPPQRPQRPHLPELDELVQHAPLPWLLQVCHSLRTLPASATHEFAVPRLPILPWARSRAS